MIVHDPLTLTVYVTPSTLDTSERPPMRPWLSRGTRQVHQNPSCTTTSTKQLKPRTHSVSLTPSPLDTPCITKKLHNKSTDKTEFTARRTLGCVRTAEGLGATEPDPNRRFYGLGWRARRYPALTGPVSARK